MDPLRFFLELSGFVFIAFSVFWSIVALMFHKRFNIPLPVALALGFVLQAVGFAIMLGISLTSKAQKASFNPTPQFGSDPFGSEVSQFADPFQGSQRFSYPEPSYKARDNSRILLWILSGVGSILLIAAAPLNWFYSFSQSNNELSVGIFSSGLEVWLLFTLLATVTAVALAIKDWSAFTPILIGYFAAWWFALSLAALTSRIAFVKGMSAFFQLPDLITYSGGMSETVAQRVGEAWLVVLPGSMLLLAAAYFAAYRYAQSAKASTNQFI